jgi:hypothetical protein
MNDLDLEREIRATFRRRGVDVLDPGAVPSPRDVVRRTRRRQAANLVLGLVTAVAVIVASIAGAGALLRSAGRSTPAEHPLRPSSLIAEEAQPVSFQDLVADTDGMLWSQYPGLTRIDPSTGSLRTFTLADDPAFGNVVDVVAAREGGVWLLLADGRVRRFDGETFLETSTRAPAQVINIAEGPDGAIWASGDVVFSWGGGAWVEAPAEGRPTTAAGAIAVDTSGNVWVATEGPPSSHPWHGVSRFDGVRWTTYPEEEVFRYLEDLSDATGSGSVGTIAPGSAGDVWVGGRGGIAHFADGAWVSYGSDLFFDLYHVTSIAVAGDDVFIGGEGQSWPGGPPAVARFDGTTWSSVVEGLEGSGTIPEFTRVVAAQEGIWATTSAGLFRMDGLRWERATIDERPAGGGPGHTIAAVGADELWMADPNGMGVWRLEGDRWTHFDQDDGVPAGRVHDFLVTRDGTVWAATTGGLGSFDGTRWEQVDADEHTVLASAPDGAVWTASTPAGHPELEGTIVGPVGGAPIAEPAPVFPVSSLAVSSDDDLWIGSNGNWGPSALGLAHYDGTAWTLVTPVEGLTDLFVQDIELGPDGTVWVALGLHDPSDTRAAPDRYVMARFDGSTWRTYLDADGQPFGWLGDLEVAADGTMLLRSERGLLGFRDDRWTLLQEGSFRPSVGSDGTVWLAGDGLFRLPNDEG